MLDPFRPPAAPLEPGVPGYSPALDILDGSNPMYFDRNGQPITLRQYGELMERPAYRIVEQEYLPDLVYVSTVWLGLNHNFFNEQAPLIFETMIFADLDQEIDQRQLRYSTIEEAEKGHRETVRLVVTGEIHA